MMQRSMYSINATFSSSSLSFLVLSSFRVSKAMEGMISLMRSSRMVSACVFAMDSEMHSEATALTCLGIKSCAKSLMKLASIKDSYVRYRKASLMASFVISLITFVRIEFEDSDKGSLSSTILCICRLFRYSFTIWLYACLILARTSFLTTFSTILALNAYKTLFSTEYRSIFSYTRFLVIISRIKSGRKVSSMYESIILSVALIAPMCHLTISGQRFLRTSAPLNKAYILIIFFNCKFGRVYFLKSSYVHFLWPPSF